MPEDKQGLSTAQWSAIAAIVVAVLGFCGVLVTVIGTGCFGRPDMCGLAKNPTSTIQTSAITPSNTLIIEIATTVPPPVAPATTMPPPTAEIVTNVAPPLTLAYYFTDAFEPNSGRIYKLENGQASVFYTRPSGQIYSLAVAPDGLLYFANANEFNVYKLQNDNETIFYAHTTYVRDIKFDSQGRLYFSEATGAGGDGIIYRLDSGSANEFYRVKLSQVDGSWAGNFAFDRSGNLWLSSGNQIPANLYKVVSGTPQRMFTSSNESFDGFSFDSSGKLIYTNFGNKIYSLTIPGFSQDIVFTSPSAEHLSSVVSATP